MVSRFLLRQQLVQYLEWYLARVKQSQTTLCNRGALEQVMTSSWLRAAKARKNPSTATVTRTRVGERHDGGGATESPLTAREAQRASAVWAWFEALGAREREGVLAVTDRSWIATVREMRRRKRGGEGNFRVYSSRRVLASGAAMKFDYVPCARAADDSRRMESALRLLDGGSVGDALLLERELIADANALRALLESLSHGRFLTSVSSSSRGGAATAATPAAKGVASASPPLLRSGFSIRRRTASGPSLRRSSSSICAVHSLVPLPTQSRGAPSPRGAPAAARSSSCATHWMRSGVD